MAPRSSRLPLGAKALDILHDSIPETHGNVFLAYTYRLPGSWFANFEEEAFRSALAAATSRRAEALAYLASAICQQGRYAEAEAMARQALEAKPTGMAAGVARSTICRARQAVGPAAGSSGTAAGAPEPQRM